MLIAAPVSSCYSVLFWDVPSSAIIKRFTGHNSRINSVAFNSESTLLASASFDATIRLWDLRSQQGRPIQVLQEAKDSVTCVTIGQGELVASSVDGNVRTYDLRYGELRTDFFDRKPFFQA
jgi:mitogen-activated protein kinase organizer 1